MTELDRIAEEITALLKEEFGCYRENSRSGVLPSCDRQFEGVTDDGNNTFSVFYIKISDTSESSKAREPYSAIMRRFCPRISRALRKRKRIFPKRNI